MGNLFDSPWKVLLVALVIIVLFGSKKLPDAARALGRSMRILKTEVTAMHDDEPASGAPGAVLAPAELTAAPHLDQQAQIDALQQQVRDLQRAATMDTPGPTVNAGAAAETRGTQPPS